ncbi:baseplate J/gp47 family protein [Desulfobaculum bizertense]|uniref:baseplate assembly protein n=1 Tax=Desulfobaculum bizertense TaxID=376490 RepID=UPI001F16403D|nr:baseplate J/gp47 family protein [Desulfobaculum bizertense]UIJ39429.1 baseplate J/gp47 family protein [Desulfobaculum bizertense]
MLPDVHFVETDPVAVESRMIGNYERMTGKKLYPGAPERLFIESVAYEVSILRKEQDHSARQNLVHYASGAALEHLGAFVETFRMEPRAAGCEMHFAGDPEHAGIVVPAGTRVSPDGQLVFVTVEDCAIAAGEAGGTVLAACEVTGALGNGFVPGQINQLVDPVPGVTAVRNVDVSLGGADAEDDEHLRERIMLAPGRFSSAGPEDAYVYWAMTAHRDIVDVAVLSPAPCEIEIYPLWRGGRIPGAEELELVREVFAPRRSRPMGDRVQVKVPAPVEYEISLRWYAEDAVSVGLVTERVAEAVDAFQAWQAQRLGRDVNPTELVHRLRSAGVKRVELTAPEFRQLSAGELARCAQVSVEFAGLEA